MLVRWLPVAAFLATAAVVACAPPTLPAGADQGGASTAANGDDDTTTTTKKAAATGTDDTTTAAPATKAAASTIPPTFDALYTAFTGCQGCHKSAGPGKEIFGADEASTYTSFKADGYNTTGGLVTPASHQGGTLTADETSALNAWVAADPG